MARTPSRKTCETGINVDTRHTARRNDECCKSKVEHVDNGTYNNDSEGKHVKYDDLNIAHRGNSLSRLDTVQHVITPKDEPIKHPIVNLCQPYIESIFFQYDSFPHTNGMIEFNNDKQGRIVKFTYFLDSSMGDPVTVLPELIKANLHATPLLQYVAGGNQKILGTFNSMALPFQLNMKIKNDEKIRLTFVNASDNDVTIMAIADIKYGEEDFE